MKFITLLLIFAYLSFSLSTFRKSRHKKAKALEREKFYFNYARMTYCDPNSVLVTAKEKFQVIQAFGVTRESKIRHNLIVSYNNKEVIFAFGGPTSEHVAYFQQIYAEDLKTIEELKGLQLNSEFWRVYSGVYRDTLKTFFKHFPHKVERITFVGHSFGGAMAIIAAYDMMTNNFQPKGFNKKNIFIYTWAALKVGPKKFDETFAILLPQEQQFFINNQVDYYNLIPECVFIPILNVWRCYEKYTYLIKEFPMFLSWVINYSPVIYEEIYLEEPDLFQMAKKYTNTPVLNAQGFPNQDGIEYSGNNPPKVFVADDYLEKQANVSEEIQEEEDENNKKKKKKRAESQLDDAENEEEEIDQEEHPSNSNLDNKIVKVLQPEEVDVNEQVEEQVEQQVEEQVEEQPEELEQEKSKKSKEDVEKEENSNEISDNEKEEKKKKKENKIQPTHKLRRTRKNSSFKQNTLYSLINSSEYLSKNCERKELYFECIDLTDYHKQFYNINVETCNFITSSIK